MNVKENNVWVERSVILVIIAGLITWYVLHTPPEVPVLSAYVTETYGPLLRSESVSELRWRDRVFGIWRQVKISSGGRTSDTSYLCSGYRCNEENLVFGDLLIKRVGDRYVAYANVDQSKASADAAESQAAWLIEDIVSAQETQQQRARDIAESWKK